MDKLNYFLNLRQTNRMINTYQTKFLELSRYDPILSKEVTISWSIEGLGEEIKFKVEGMSPPTLAEAVRKALIFEEDIRKKP